MTAHLHDWLELIFRWFHVIVGVAWIGASFYFNFLENRLDRAASRNREGMAGHLWAIHGGGFYYLEKFKVAPPSLPQTLHWFKWEAYFTWITGMVLLILVYYLNTQSYLIDPRVADLSPALAIVLGLATLAVSWVVYDQLCKSRMAERPMLLAGVIAVLLVLLSIAMTSLYGGRGAFIHVGAAMGTIMVANVFFVIIPNQRDLVDALKENRAPDGDKGKAGLQRSRHNNYLTLPVLFIMISNHYPSTYAHEWNWLVLVLIMAAGAAVRHYFNVRHLPQRKVWILPAGALLMVLAFFITMPDTRAPGGADLPEISEPVDDQAIRAVLDQRCIACHAANVAQGGIRLQDDADVHRLASRIHATVVGNRSMPPGNVTGITDEERAMISAWYQGLER